MHQDLDFDPPNIGPDDPGLALPDDLVDAVVGHVRAALVAVDDLTWFGIGLAPEGQALPYATIDEPDEDDTYWTTQGDALADGHLEVTAYHQTKREARRLGDRLAALLQDAPLYFQAGTLVYLRQSGRSASIDPDPAPDGGDCWAEVRQFNFKYSY